MLNQRQKILHEATELFLEKGFAMTSTIEIARKVGCNQALVHYYFHTKEQLFQQVFMAKTEAILGLFVEMKPSGNDFFSQLENYINAYFDMLVCDRRLPFFIFNELLLNDRRRCFLRQMLIRTTPYSHVYYVTDAAVQREVHQGIIRPIKTIDLLLNIVSLTVMSFLALPIYRDVLQCNAKEVNTYLQQRRREVVTTIVKSLQP